MSGRGAGAFLRHTAPSAPSAAVASSIPGLYKIAINTAQNYWSRRGRRPPTDDVAIGMLVQLDGGIRLRESATPR